VDDIAASRLYGIHLQEIEMIRKAIDQCGRDIVLSLSPGPAPVEHAEKLKTNANMWRITDDYWDRWELLYDMFEKCEKWSKYISPGNWPDCDMLPLGHIGIRSVDGGGSDRWTRFTKDEQITMMTLLGIFRSPLMFGGELRNNDDWTLSLLTNKAVLNMHRNSYDNKLVYRKDDNIVWTAKDESHTYVALFNAKDKITNISVTADQLGLSSVSEGTELWTNETLHF
jgi:hypothetical protein